MADREMTNEEAIEILGGIRACYNIFDEYDEPKYAALSKAIFALKAEPAKRGMSKNDSLTQNYLSQHVGFVGYGESNANALEPNTGTPCLICGEFIEGWDFPICHECRKRLKNILYAPIGQLNPEPPVNDCDECCGCDILPQEDCPNYITIENDGTYEGGNG